MPESILETAAKNGVWALLFVALLLYVLKQNDAREKGYQAIISQLSTEIKADLHEIKEHIFGGNK